MRKTEACPVWGVPRFLGSNPPACPIGNEHITKSSTRSSPLGETRQLWDNCGFASRASKKVPQGPFCPPDCSAGRCCSNPPASMAAAGLHKKNACVFLHKRFLGGRGWIRTTEAESSRFTVCPHWPLGNTPIFSCCASVRRTTCLF